MENGNGERRLTPQEARRQARLREGFAFAHDVEMKRRGKTNGNGNGKKAKPAIPSSVSKPEAESEITIPEPDPRILERKRDQENSAFRKDIRPEVAMKFASTIRINRNKLMPKTPEADLARQQAYKMVERDAILAKQKKLRGRFLQSIVKRAGELARRK